LGFKINCYKLSVYAKAGGLFSFREQKGDTCPAVEVIARFLDEYGIE
jgi:hypothetical protein